MCTVLLPPGDNPIAVNKYIISYHIINNGRVFGWIVCCVYLFIIIVFV